MTEQKHATEAQPEPIEVRLSGTLYSDVSISWAFYLADPNNEKSERIPALQLFVSDEGFPELLATATTNLPGIIPEPGQVFIKDWSENEGMFASLVRAGVLEDTGDAIEVNQWGSLARVGVVLPPYRDTLRAALDLPL